MFTVLLGSAGEAERDRLMALLAGDGIETRPAFYPIHTLPPYRTADLALPVSETAGARGISLPTHAGLSDDDVSFVSARLLHHLDSIFPPAALAVPAGAEPASTVFR